jgi:preprotein translocase subunit YajC
MTVPVFPSLAVLQLSGLGNVAPMVFTYGAIFAIFYFVLIRPQQKQKKQHDELIRQLKKGDEVVTAGGVVGEVVFISQQTKDGAPNSTMEDRITIKSGESRIIIERGKITRIASATGS